MFTVIRTSGENYINGAPVKNQCGGAVKTVAKAYALMARMRAQQAPGSSNSFSVERV